MNVSIPLNYAYFGRMNIKEKHQTDKPVSALSIFKGSEGNVIALQIKAGAQLKEHITKIPAILICVEGIAIYGSERGEEITLGPGEYFLIDPDVRHWVDGKEDCQLLLIK